jgi:flagellin-like hook-associated protein FlgL
MSIIGIPNTRVSDLFIRMRLLEQIQLDQTDMFRLQTQLSTGHRFQTPSEEPVAALRVMSLQRLLERKEQIRTNLNTNQSYLSATDAALSQVSNLLADARAATLSVMGTTASDTQRLAVAQQVEQSLRQLLDTANQNFRGRYLFAGSASGQAPFSMEGMNVVRYDGNEDTLPSYANLDLLFDTNLPGSEVFGAISQPVRGSVDLDPILTWNTRLADLRHGQGISPGSIAVSDGTDTKIIDVSRAETIGDLAALIHANPPAGRTIFVDVTTQGLVLQLDGGDLSIREVGGGTTAFELGIRQEIGVGTNPIIGADLDPTLRLTTPLDNLLGARARAVVRTPLPDNDIIFEAKDPGTAWNGVEISFFDDHTVVAGHEVATYTSPPPQLRVNIESGRTRAIDVINAVNSAVPPLPFTARLDPLDDEQGGVGPVVVTTSPVTTSGGRGVAFDKMSGLQITNGGTTHVISLATAQTLEDVLNILNGSSAGVVAEINQAGTGIDVRSRLSGSAFAIGENGGLTATQLGLRTFNEETRLAELNYGRGVSDHESTGGTGGDFLITRSDGVSFEINVHGAKTIGDVIDLINTNPTNLDPTLGSGVPVVARLAVSGNGIELVDNSLGLDALSVTRIHQSLAAIDLGLVAPGQESAVSPSPGPPYVLTGSDVHLLETDGLFTALSRIVDGLQRNDLWQVERAMDMLDRRTVQFNFARAELGARQQGLDVLQQRLDDENVELQSAMSLDYDADLAEVITNLTARQAAYQASLKATAEISQLSLLDYL